MNTVSALIEYGLTSKQAKVYITCLEFGSASIQGISKKLQIARSSCEAILDQLQRKGFISSFKHRSGRRYSAEDPRRVVDVAIQKGKLLSASLPDLMGMYMKNKTVPAVRMYEGKEGMNTVLEEILDEAKILYGFGSVDDLYKTLGTTFPEFTKRRIQKKIPVKIILKDTPLARKRQELGPKELREVRLVRDVGDFSNLLFIWNYKIALFSLREEVVAIVLESKELTTGQKAMFDFMWMSL